MSDQKQPNDMRIRQTPLNRWENEGGATVTGHEKPGTKTLRKKPTNALKPQSALLRKNGNGKL